MILNCSSTLRIFTRALSVTTKQCLEHQHANKKLLKVAIVGAPNAGKSTLLNRLINCVISGVSKRVHTTRSNILGVITQNETQLEFYDTPGLVTRQHLLRHKLEDSMLFDPRKAVFKCDLIAVVVDASNIREQKRLNKGILSLLEMHSDKESVLILNKVDLVKDKRKLIDIGIRLTQGCLSSGPTLRYSDVLKMPRSQIKDLNLTSYLRPDDAEEVVNPEKRRPEHKYVIDLNKVAGANLEVSDCYVEPSSAITPDMIGYKNFSDIFSISALHDDGVNELRNHFISRAVPVESWPHGPDFLTDRSTKNLVHEAIWGKLLDYVPHVVPYLVKFRYLKLEYDEMGSMHVSLQILCPERYMVPMVLGERGVNIFRVIEDSRDVISQSLNCDVKLSIMVDTIGDRNRNKNDV